MLFVGENTNKGTKLLQKIEELPFYAIQQQKQNDKLSAMLDKLTQK